MEDKILNNVPIKRLPVKKHYIFVTDEVWEKLQNLYTEYESLIVPRQNILDTWYRDKLGMPLSDNTVDVTTFDID